MPPWFGYIPYKLTTTRRFLVTGRVSLLRSVICPTDSEPAVMPAATICKLLRSRPGTQWSRTVAAATLINISAFSSVLWEFHRNPIKSAANFGTYTFHTVEFEGLFIGSPVA